MENKLYECYKYWVEDKDLEIPTQEFDCFADAAEYAKKGLVVFIHEVPCQDGVCNEDEDRIVWSYDDLWNNSNPCDYYKNHRPEICVDCGRPLQFCKCGCEESNIDNDKIVFCMQDLRESYATKNQEVLGYPLTFNDQGLEGNIFKSSYYIDDLDAPNDFFVDITVNLADGKTFDDVVDYKLVTKDDKTTIKNGGVYDTDPLEIDVSFSDLDDNEITDTEASNILGIKTRDEFEKFKKEIRGVGKGDFCEYIHDLAKEDPEKFLRLVGEEE